MDLLYILIIGAVAGWLAGLIWKGGGFGLLWNIILGIVGSFVGGWLLGKLGVNVGIGSPTVSLIITSVIGAVVVLFIASLIKRR
ncbi:MAG: GlsB/YeaQ/YmgE family stress response membrane protein [Saprospiraceae bacterium]|nr:GlsB/YeaQ/YmgE family stress response membrane protein [Saprospiraceae bacterium]